MNAPAQFLRRRLRSGARSLAYSSASRNIARRLVEDPAAHRLRALIEERGHGAKLHRLASQQLPEGRFFAKLTILKWHRHRNRSFRLFEGDELVYGNRIEAPARGFELEYRNIIVGSDDPADFHLDIDAEYTLTIGRGAFTTAQQVRYDEQYGVKQHGDLFYSLRGNLKNPRRALVTFPGFGPSTSRISYAVSFLKGITDEDLSDTLMICFQDRYMVAGTYMLTDNAGVSLRGRVHAEIQGLLHRYSIAEQDLMLFGASKGGSTATCYAEGFPKARLLAVVPQMNLPYYLDKPFFRDNLYRVPALRQEPQPGDLMRRYFAEGRRIDYFYTDRDEQSNVSLIEFAADVPGLTKYRVDGEHSEVAKKALPTILSVMKQFMRGDSADGADPALSCDQLVAFPEEESTGYQLRLANQSAIPAKPTTNVLLAGNLGRTRFRQDISAHTYPFVKYTAPGERLRGELHGASAMRELHVTSSDGDLRRCELPAPSPRVPAPGPAPDPGLCAPLDLTPSTESRTYSLLAGANTPVSRFEYQVTAGDEHGDAVTVVFAADPAAPLPAEVAGGPGAPRLVVTVSASPRTVGAALLVHRIAIAAGVESVHVLVTDPSASDAEVAATRRLYGPSIRCEDLREQAGAAQPVPAGIG